MTTITAHAPYLTIHPDFDRVPIVRFDRAQVDVVLKHIPGVEFRNGTHSHVIQIMALASAGRAVYLPPAELKFVRGVICGDNGVDV